MQRTMTFALKNGETFEAKFTRGSCSDYVNVTLYKIRPNPKWWQSKKMEIDTALLDARRFSYNFRNMGMAMISVYLSEQAHEDRIKKMWGN